MKGILFFQFMTRSFFPWSTKLNYCIVLLTCWPGFWDRYSSAVTKPSQLFNTTYSVFQHCWLSICKLWPNDYNTWIQHLATLATLLRRVAVCWVLKIKLVCMPRCNSSCNLHKCCVNNLNTFKFEPTTPNTSQQGGQTSATGCSWDCWDILQLNRDTLHQNYGTLYQTSLKRFKQTLLLKLLLSFKSFKFLYILLGDNIVELISYILISASS